MLPDTKCVDCKKYNGCLQCEKYPNKIPSEVLEGKCSEYEKSDEK